MSGLRAKHSLDSREAFPIAGLREATFGAAWLFGTLRGSGKDSAAILRMLSEQAAEFHVFWTQGRNIGEEMVASMEAVRAGNNAEGPVEEVAGIGENEVIEAALEEQASTEGSEALAEEQPPDSEIEAPIEEQAEAAVIEGSPEEQVSAEGNEVLAEEQPPDSEIEAPIEEQAEAAVVEGSPEEQAVIEEIEASLDEEAGAFDEEALDEAADELSEMGDIPVEDWDYQRPRRGEIRTGVILSIGEQEIIIDVGAKRDGIVPYADMQRMGEEALAKLRVGSEVPVYVLRPEDQEGNLLLSLYMAREQQSWIRAQEMFDSGEVWEEEVIGYNKGGLVVPLDDIRGFVPASQVPGFPHGLNQEDRLTRLSTMVGETLPVKVIEINRRKRRLILSATAAQQDWRKQARTRLLEDLREGQVRKGTVSSLCSFGAFVDLGGADGLVHISELSWRRIRHPREAISVGEEVEVYVLRLDHERQRIGLSLKRLLPEPWALVEDKYELGQLIEGVVTNVVDFGAFAEVEDGVEGLIHVSELAEATISHPRDVVKKGDLLLLRVIRIDTRRKRLGLSLKRVLESEWAEWAARLAAATAEEEAAAKKTEEEAAAKKAEEAAEEAAEAPAEEPAVEAAAGEAPVAEEPVAEEPVVEAVEEAADAVAEAVEEPAVEEPVIEEPVAEVVEEAADAVAEAVEAAVAEEPVVEAVEEPAAEAAGGEAPVAEVVEEAADAVAVAEELVVEAVAEAIEEPVVEEPAGEAPVAEEPVVEAVAEAIEEPVVEEPVIEEPVIEEPVIEEPVIEEPVIEEPVIEEPVIEEPVIEEPVIEEPVAVEAPAGEAPVAEVVEEAADAVADAVEEPVVEEPVAEVVEEAVEAADEATEAVTEEPATEQEEPAQDLEPATVRT